MPFGNHFGHQGSSWDLLGPSWGPLGSLLGPPGSLLGPPGSHLGTTLGPLEESLEPFWSSGSSWEAVWTVLGAIWTPKNVPKGTRNGSQRHQKSLSERIPHSTAFYMQCGLEFHRYLHEIAECRRNAHPLKTSISTVFHEVFLTCAFGTLR